MSEGESTTLVKERPKMAQAVNRTGVEDLLFAGSSFKLSDTEGYGLTEATRDLRAGKVLPDFMFQVKNPDFLSKRGEINEDRKHGIRGYLFVFQNIHSQAELPPIGEDGKSPHEWPVKAGMDGTEIPIIDPNYKEYVEVGKNKNGGYTLRLKDSPKIQ